MLERRFSAIDDYAERYQIQLFDRAIDWGWFWFLTKPIFAIVHYLFELTGNFGVAILLMTVILKIGLFWFANKSYVSMAHMRRRSPRSKPCKNATVMTGRKCSRK